MYVVVYVSLDDFQLWLTQKVRCNHPSKAHLPFHFALEGHVPIQYGHLQGSRRAIAFGDYFKNVTRKWENLMAPSCALKVDHSVRAHLGEDHLVFAEVNHCAQGSQGSDAQKDWLSWDIMHMNLHLAYCSSKGHRKMSGGEACLPSIVAKPKARLLIQTDLTSMVSTLVEVDLRDALHGIGGPDRGGCTAINDGLAGVQDGVHGKEGAFQTPGQNQFP